MDNNYNNLSLVQLIIKWKWHILIITVIAAICGAFFSSATFITPLYKSEAIAYPANISPYSDESETEQMLQIINSQSIIDSIVEKYDLWTDYKIDRNYQYAKTYLMLESHDKIKISKTPYEAVSIVVYDKNPQVACDIAKDILNFYDQKVGSMHREKAREVVDMYAKQLELKQQDIDNLKKQLTALGTDYHMANYVGQSREITRGYINGSAKATELMQNLEESEKQLNHLLQEDPLCLGLRPLIWRTRLLLRPPLMSTSSWITSNSCGSTTPSSPTPISLPNLILQTRNPIRCGG